jgi:hypothetical protein
MNPNETKRCRKCEADLPRSEFWRHGRAADRLQSWCKTCQRASVATYFENNPGRKSELMAEWLSRPGNAERQKRHVEAYKARNPHKRAAHREVEFALRSGDLARPARCEACGKKHERIHAHHEDYDRPLDVIWLCQPCHVLLHKMKREGTKPEKGLVSK